MFQNRFEVIDAHCHIYPQKIANKAAESVGAFYHEAPACGGTLEELMELGGSVGVDRYIVQSVATAPKQVASINRFIASEVEAHPDKLIGFGTLHPESADQQADLSELCSLGLRGVKLHPDIQGFCIDDERCLRIYDLCQEAGLPILMHTGDHRYDMSNPNRLIPVLKRFPALTVIGAHFGGWSVWKEACEELCEYSNLIVDCSSSLSYIPLEDSRNIIRRYGAERVLFGTDFPLHSPINELSLFEQLGLEDWENEAILSGNVKKLLHI